MPLVLAVADGHGSDRYFRSNIGAEIAVKVAKQELLRFAQALPLTTTRSTIRDMGEKVPSIIVRR